MAQNNVHVKGNGKWVSDDVINVVDHILSGTTEQAEEILRGFKGYRPIPGNNMMTKRMISKFIRGIRANSALAYANKYHVPHIKGKWETDDEKFISISGALKEAGINCEPSEGMKMVGCKTNNCRVNLYDPKGVLAIMYACATSRPRIDRKVRDVYGLPMSEPMPTEVIPARHDVKYQAEFTPEFFAELVKICVRESVAAALQMQAPQQM